MALRTSGHERRRLIVEAAAALFSRQGFNGTTTREVAKAAGVSEATIFKHFATKEELYRAIIEAKAQTQQLLGAVGPLVGGGNEADLLKVLAREMITRTLADPTLMRLLLFSALEGHALSELFFRRRMQAVDEFLSEYIAQRIAAGTIRWVDPAQAAWNFIGMVVQYLLLRELFQQKAPPHITVEQAVDDIVTTFLQGVRA
jgi:AcrR family transcriptional regulator